MADELESGEDPETQPLVKKSHLGFPVVGIGASAGGIGALQRLFDNMPDHPGMAFVVVLHLSPHHVSSLDSIVQQVTRMRVLQVQDSVPIEVDHIYVIPPAKALSMTDGTLRLSTPDPRTGRYTSIDHFFRSLAQAHRERAIGMVLSGTGADGTQGLKRIKEQGGVTLVQSPEDAEYDGMPRSAVATGLVDFVMPVVEMPQKLIDLWQNASKLELPSPPPDMDVDQPPSERAVVLAEEALIYIKSLLRKRTGHDFTHYKRATVIRRLERRMQVAQTATLPEYAAYLEAIHEETQSLLQDMLISVTNFFRDREAFETLERALMSRFAESSIGEDGLRAWAVGCATGEEAYSIAILLDELVSSRPAKVPIQVFASDIDQRALDVGRGGTYPESIVTDVPPTRLRQYFNKVGEEYRISKPIRDSILFSLHNVLRDPPFTRLDLVCCRNLLIYLDQKAQLQLLETFHFALKPGGLLFLGSAETADAAPELFVVIDKRHRVYAARQTARTSRVPPLMPSLAAMTVAARPPSVRPTSPLEALHIRANDRLAPATVLIDAGHEIIHVGERASHLLRLPAGAPSNNILKLVRTELRGELRTALFHSSRSNESVEARRVSVSLNGSTMLVTMNVHPLDDEGTGRCFLVVFNEAQQSLATDPMVNSSQFDPVVVALESEVQRLTEQLSGTMGESAASTEELRASNEELQTINEELRSATEELETSKEELQSVNEELITVNGELNNKVDETAKINDDLQNLISSIDIGTIFVDRAIRIKRFTPPATKLFNMLASDAGRPLLDITNKLDYEDLASDVAATLQSLQPTEREVASTDGHWYLVRVLPYRTSEDRIDGAVLNFIDISARRKAEERLNTSEQRLRLVADSMADYAIMTLDEGGLVTSWSRGCERLFGYSEGEVLGRPGNIVFSPEDIAEGVPQAEMRKALAEGSAGHDRWLVRKDGTRFFCSGIMTPLVHDGLKGYAKIARDLTYLKLAEVERDAVQADLESTNLLKDEFFAVVSHELKNPLNLIQVSAELLLRTPQLRDFPIVQRTGATIKRTVASQAQIINDLLDLSRMKTGKLMLKPSRVEVRPLIDNVAEALREEATSHRQALEFTLEPGLFVQADPVRVEQIVWNLLTNAMKFTPEGGTIEVSAASDDGFARFTVSDNGIGIDPRLLGQVFDMFRQAGAGAAPSKGGLGIGLALVKQLAEMQGGRVLAESEGLGEGAALSVWLPLDTQVAESALPAMAPVKGFSGLSILWVDDETSTLEALSELMIMEGADVTTADNVDDALEIAESGRFDIVISDIAMPHRDGYDLIAALRRLPGTRDSTAIAVTGLGREGDRNRALAAGFDAHLSKPLEIEELLSTINHVQAARRPA